MSASDSCLLQQTTRINSKSTPISSALLDKLLMSSLSSNNVKPTRDGKVNSSQNIKRTSEEADYDHSSATQSYLSSSVSFTPPQLFKMKKKVQKNIGSNEGNVSEQYSKNLKVSDQKSPANNSTSSSRIPIVWDRTDSISSKVGNSTSSSESEGLCNSTPETSLYITPENTPKSLGVPVRPCSAKRSLSEHFEDDQLTHELSNNSSAYYTPESSPAEYGSSVKRFKNRWSDLSTPCSNRSTYSNGGPSPSWPLEKSDYEPALIGYQLIGDSQFCRFGQQLLGLQRVPTPNSSGRIGICVSGQTITDLHKRVKEKFYPISDKIILMIGTNDFLRNVDVMTMCKELSALIETLQEMVTNIVLLTLPPIPKLEKRHHTRHFALLDKYNGYIRSLSNGDRVRIADISPLYMSTPPYQKCRMHLFELFFSGPARRPDLIHLNRQGLELIRKYILDNFL